MLWKGDTDEEGWEEDDIMQIREGVREGSDIN
jgi:hypothetical protein